LLGADRVVTTDTSNWLRKTNFDRTARFLLRSKSVLRPIYERYLAAELRIFDDRVRLLEATNGDTSELFKRGLVEYVVTKDLTFTPSEFSDYDLVFSNSVLQRMPVMELKAFIEAKASTRATHFHRIDCADFQAMRNRSIHRLDYLLVDEDSWNRWTSKYLNYQNRLRSFEFLALFKNYGYETRIVDAFLAPESAAFVHDHEGLLKQMYGAHQLRDVAVTNFSLIATAPQAPHGFDE
jgi:hypothetical protein